MGPRPAHLDLSDDRAQTPQPPRMNFHMDLPSPRTGEAPPALSPLDAFALHSRILAKQFDQEAQNGRRISRLAPVAVAKELANRPDFFRNVSGGSEMSTMSELPDVQEEERPTTRGGVTVAGYDEKDRPVSHYPMLGSFGKGLGGSPAATPYYDAEESQQAPEVSQDYFGIDVPRAASPEPVDPRLVNVQAPSPAVPSLTNSVDSVQSSHPRTLTNGSARSQRSQRPDHGLLPPKSPGFPKSPRSMHSIRSVLQDSGDEDGSSFNGAYATSRKFSGSSNMSRPQSPFSPFMPPIQRSPSMTSEYSVNSSRAPSQQQRQAFNFSRPLSSGGQSRPSLDTRTSLDSRPSYEARPSTELPLRHPSEASNDTRPSAFSTNPSSRQNSADDVRTPYAGNVHIDTPGELQKTNGDYFSSSSEPYPAGSYIYTKYSLPRGRTVERNSAGSRDSWIQHQFTWDEKNPLHAITQDEPPAAPPSVLEKPPQRQREDSATSAFTAPVRPSSPTGSTGSERISGMRLSNRDRTVLNSALRSRSAAPDSRFAQPAVHRPSPSVDTESTGRTTRAVPLHQRSPSAELTPEEHLEIGIQAHSSGALNKSTYHLRTAARAGLPTAMLLYALACRHGWGMRPNQEEGVMWLRKAIESSGLEVADVEDTVSAASRSPKADPVAEAAERRKRKGQFALAIYELGISYMNGWGCPKDKPLAVRCYEVAGNWGDCDALAEAGFCYTQGVGCKKDLRQAAALYRKAAEGGMSMAGNSW